MPPPQTQTVATQSNPVDFSSPDIYTRISGTFVFGEGQETFRPCGAEQDYWIFTVNEDMWTDLRDKHTGAASEPYDAVYIELFGWLGPRLHPVIGGDYAAEYDGHIVVDDVLTIRPSSLQDCEG